MIFLSCKTLSYLHHTLSPKNWPYILFSFHLFRNSSIVTLNSRSLLSLGRYSLSKSAFWSLIFSIVNSLLAFFHLSALYTIFEYIFSMLFDPLSSLFSTSLTLQYYHFLILQLRMSMYINSTGSSPFPHSNI